MFSIDRNSSAHTLLGGTPDAGLVVVANVVQAQWWGRDPGFPAPDNTMLSDAIEWIVAP